MPSLTSDPGDLGRPLATTARGQGLFPSLRPRPPPPHQRLLLQDLHDSHVCNSLLVAESEEDLWRSETPYHSRQRAPPPSDGKAHAGAPRTEGCCCPFLYSGPGGDAAGRVTVAWSSAPGDTGQAWRRGQRRIRIWLLRVHQ